LDEHRGWELVDEVHPGLLRREGTLLPFVCFRYGRLENAQQMVGHESPRTTKLYDRTKENYTERGGANPAVTLTRGR